MKKILVKIKGFIAYDLGLLELRFFWKTKKYLSNYYNPYNDLVVKDHRTLIYMLDGRAYSGGLSDIIKGILSLYKFSKEIGFDFKINFCFPYSLHNYLEPNLFDWLISENEISYNSNYSAYLWIYNSYNIYGKSTEFEALFQKRILQKFIKKNISKKQFHIYTNSEWVRGDEYSLLFNELFKPSKSLKDTLNYHKSILGNEYISMTFRFQQLLGDFEVNDLRTDNTGFVIDLLIQSEVMSEGISSDQSELQIRALLGNGDFKNKRMPKPLNERAKIELINRCINKLVQIHATQFSKLKVLITSDSEIFLDEVSKLDFVYEISENSLTREKSHTNGNYDPFLKAYIDIFMLAESQKLHLICAGPMYRSGFAKNASFINNKEYHEVIF